MATIKFFTRSKVSKLVPVYLRYIDGREIDFWLPTPYRLFPDYWNVKTQTLKQRILYTEVFTEKEAKDIEDKFTQLKDFILREHFKLTELVTRDWLRATIDKFYYKETPSNENLTEYIRRFVAEAKSGKRLARARNTKKRYAYGTLRVLTGFMQSFETFCKETGKQYNYNDINIDWYDNFIQFFYKRNCGDNYIGKHIRSLKNIMRQAREEGLHTNTEFERKAFKSISSEVDHIYLTEAELKRLFELDLSDNKLHQVVRDVFLAGCYTAQRYSDYKRINKSMIKVISGVKHIELVQDKTGEKCLIPIRPELETILKRYDYTLPRTFEEKINLNIKLIGAKAKITEPIAVESMKGGLKVKTSVKKYDLIKTHTARRTGCSLMYLAGIPIIDIMKISGHRTPTEFLKYIRISKEETVVKLSTHPYFAGNKLRIAT